MTKEKRPREKIQEVANFLKEQSASGLINFPQGQDYGRISSSSIKNSDPFDSTGYGRFALLGVVGLKLIQSWISHAYPYEEKSNLRGKDLKKRERHERQVTNGFKRRARVNAPRAMEELASLDPEELAELSGISIETVDEIMKGVVELCKIHQEEIRRPQENCDYRYRDAVKKREDKKHGQEI